jgi:hypothetical protein
MTTITLNDFNAVPTAVAWCNETMPKEEWWDMRVQFSSNTTYDFVFENEKYATLFALKWVH